MYLIPLLFLAVLAGGVSSGSLEVKKQGVTLNKPALSKAFQAGKADHWKNLNK